MNWSEKLLELEGKATEGPWSKKLSDTKVHITNVYKLTSPTNDVGDLLSWDAELTVHLRNKAREIAALVEAGNAVIAWCDKNPPAGNALWCVQQLRQALAALEDAK